MSRPKQTPPMEICINDRISQPVTIRDMDPATMLHEIARCIDAMADQNTRLKRENEELREQLAKTGWADD